MRLRQRIRIEAPAEAVWAQVADPEQWPGFHPRVARVEPLSGGCPRLDSWYEIEFEMKRRRLLHRARVKELLPCRAFRMDAECSSPDGSLSGPIHVGIAYELSDGGAFVDVRETFDVTGHGMPRWATLIVWLIQRFGRPVEPGSLDQLKLLLESASSVELG